MNRGMSEDAVKRRTRPAETTAPAEAAEAAETVFEASAGLLSVDGIEVTQAVQDMNHSVPLIAGKTTVVRVYLSRPDCANKTVEVRFVNAAPLRIRLISLRYRTNGAPNGHVPRALDVSLFRSWLGRAYPVSRVIFSQATVDTNIRPPFRSNTSDKTNAQLTTIRRLDVSNGTDQRTHYYGMVYDARDFFMRGSASALPTNTPDPTAVASGPTGDPESRHCPRCRHRWFYKHRRPDRDVLGRRTRRAVILPCATTL